MKKEVSCCDSCERILDRGGLRMKATGNSPEEVVDLCPECLAEILPEYSDRTGEELLAVQISREDFLVLMGDGTEEETEEDAQSVFEDTPVQTVR